MPNKYDEIKFVAQFFELIDSNPIIANTITMYKPNITMTFKGPYVLLTYENGLNIIVNSYDYDEIIHHIKTPIDVLNATDNFYLFKI